MCLLESDEDNGVKFIVPINIIAEFYSPALVYSAGEWLEEGMIVPIEQMVEYCDTIASVLQTNHKNQ